MTIAAIGMSQFNYSARDQQGRVAHGTVSAANLAEASRAIRAEGKFPVKIEPAKAARISAARRNIFLGKVKREELIHFTIQISVMIDTGVPLSEALHSLSEQTVSDAFKAVLLAIENDVQSGQTFSAALERHSRVFPRYYISLVKASEISGTMSAILHKLADYLASQHETIKRVRGALVYPAFMLVMTVGVTIFLLTFVMPKFTAIFAQNHAKLPAPTRFLMALSGGLTAHWALYAIGTIAAAIGSVWFSKTKRGAAAIDFIELRMPVLGRMFHTLYLSRSLQTLGTMIQSGVPMLDGLQIVQEVSGNIYYDRLWTDVSQNLRQGQSLSDPLLKSKLVPKSVSQMIHSGEKAGQLSRVLDRISQFMEEDLRTVIKTSTQMIEPIMICVMGAIIGTVAIAMLLPILTISKVMAH